MFERARSNSRVVLLGHLFWSVVVVGLTVGPGLAERPERSVVAKRSVQHKLRSPAVEKHAFLVGFKTYEGASVSNVPYSHNDIRLVRDTLETFCGYKSENIVELTDDDPDDRRFLNPVAFRDLLQHRLSQLRVGYSDSVLFYYTGHGYLDPLTKQGYFTFPQFDVDNPAATGLLMSELSSLLNGCPAQTKLVVLDMCHAGAFKHVQAGNIEYDKLKSYMRDARGTFTLASCGRRQLSYPWPEKRQSVFSAFLARGLQGAADKPGMNGEQESHATLGIIDHLELYRYLAEHVSETARNLPDGGQQEPQLILGDGAVGVVPIARATMCPSTHRLVETKRNAVYRIEVQRPGNRPLFAGTAFAFAASEGRAYLATAARNLRDRDGRFFNASDIRLRHRFDDQRQLDVEELFFPEQWQQPHLSQVAVMRLRVPAALNPPVLFNLVNDKRAVQPNASCAYLGIKDGACKRTSSCYREAKVARLADDRQEFRIVPDKHVRCTGAPVFTINNGLEFGTEKYDQVLGICSDAQVGREIEVISIVRLHEFFSLIRSHRLVQTAAGFSVVQLVAARPVEVNANLQGTRNWADELRFALEKSVAAGRRRDFKQALDPLDALRRRRGFERAYPWEFYALEGSIRTNLGLQHTGQGRREIALQHFQNALHYTNAAVYQSPPGTLYPQFLAARVRNNLGTPTQPPALTEMQQRYLGSVHDEMKDLLDRHKVGKIQLSRVDQARCHYLLGYAHRFIGQGRVCQGDPRDDFRESYKLYPSQQVQAQMRHLELPFPNRPGQVIPDIWDEFDTIHASWSRRSSSECEDCNAHCPACG